MKDRFDTKEEVIVGYRVSEARKKLWINFVLFVILLHWMNQ